MIQVSMTNVKKFFGAQEVLQDVNLEIQDGDRVGLVGRNGEGKSTIFRILAGYEKEDSGVVAKKKDETIGYVEQIPQYSSDDTCRTIINRAFGDVMKIAEEMRTLEERMCTDFEHMDQIMARYDRLQTKYESMDGYSVNESIAKVCNGLQISDRMLEQQYAVLSGGEKTLVMLAVCLLQKPSILLLDEPTNHLDLATIEWLETFLREYKGSTIIVSHDRYFLDQVVNKIYEIEDGKTTAYFGNYSYYLVERSHRQELQMIEYKNQQKKIKAMEKSIRDLMDWGNRGGNDGLHSRAGSIQKSLDRMERVERPVEKKNINLDFADTERSGKDVLILKKVEKSFNKLLFSDVNMHIRYGERIAIIGKNGHGKSVLLKLILGIFEPDNGQILRGANLKIGYMPQEITFNHPEHTVIEEFRDGYIGTSEKARSILSRFLFYNDQVNKIVGKLSGGELARLRLCQLMYQDINFLIMDEPTNHLDIASREVLEEALADFAGTILFVSHDRYFINKLAQKTYVVENTCVTEYIGGYDDYREISRRRC